MTINLPLRQQKEAGLIALVREAVDRILPDAPERPMEPEWESRPIWDVILDNMKDVTAEEFAWLPKDGASEHDHYLYGHAKRNP